MKISGEGDYKDLGVSAKVRASVEVREGAGDHEGRPYNGRGRLNRDAVAW